MINSKQSGGDGGTSPTQHKDNRGQTLPDFVVGIAIFLITVSFLFQFIPQLTQPYENQEQSVVVQRATTDLSKHLLAEAETTAQLNETCTVSFFQQTGGEACPFNTDDSLSAQLGLGQAYTLNVTLRTAPSNDPNTELLCNENGSIGNCNTGDELRVGPPIPSGDRSVATGIQRVFVGNTTGVIEVTVW